ncbi:MAG: NUDIX domain-containing protein [Candidatus Liptonbacteria bacterium]|nr:NUDIX domain-containing protein [Candidatus Liptonbacteria bacterium]
MKRKKRKFKPKPGQVDYTYVRFAPVINCVLKHGGKILIVRRSRKMRLYPTYWNGIGGFLDDQKTLEGKVKEELREELGVKEKDILSIGRGDTFEVEEPKHKKVWIVHPVLALVKNDRIKLNWEADEYRWVKLAQTKNFKLAPSFKKVLEALFNFDETMRL